MSFLSGLYKKILERLEQERTEPAAILVGMLQPVTFQYHHKKILRQVLRVLSRIPASANKRENGPPIAPAKLGQIVACLLLFAPRVCGRKDEAPPGGGKRARSAGALRADLLVHERTLWSPLSF